MSDADEWEWLLEQCRKLPPMTEAQKRAQSIDFAVGNLMLDRPEYDEWDLRKYAAEAWERRQP